MKGHIDLSNLEELADVVPETEAMDSKAFEAILEEFDGILEEKLLEGKGRTIFPLLCNYLLLANSLCILLSLENVRKRPIWNLIALCSSLCFCLFSNCWIKRLECEGYFQEQMKSYRRVLLNIRKALGGVFLAFHIFPILGNLFYLGERGIFNFQISRENPYNSKQIESFEEESVEDFLTNVLERNPYLTEEEKEQFWRLTSYFYENPYLSYEKLYETFATTEVFYEENRKKEAEFIVAEYFRNTNEIVMYNGNPIESCLSHEVVHSTGCFQTQFLNEGFDSILISEYVDDGYIFSYFEYVYLTQIIIELAGKGTVLEAYSKEDENFLVQKLGEKTSLKEAKQLIRGLDKYAASLDDELFYSVGKKLFDFVQKMDLSVNRQAYIYNCFMHTYNFSVDYRMPQLSLDDECSFYDTDLLALRLPKFWYNQEKDQSYPEWVVPHIEIVERFQQIIGSRFPEVEEEQVLCLER